MSLEEINEKYGTSFTLGCEVLVDRGSKTPHIGMVVGTDGDFLKLVRDGENFIYDAVYDPMNCSIIG